MDTPGYFCPNPDCPKYGIVVSSAWIVGKGSDGPFRRLRCLVCGRTFLTLPRDLEDAARME